jgi:phosphoglycolate phosphatase-like HAD superfamily hydrolase
MNASMSSSGPPIAVLFDIDGTLLTTGGAGTRSWRSAFDALFGVPADIGSYTDAGMTDPEVGRRTFERVLGHDPTPQEMASLLAAYLRYLPGEVAASPTYRVLPGVRETLEALRDRGVLLGIVTGGLEAAAAIKLARGELNHFFTFGGYGSDSAIRSELTSIAIQRAATVLGQPVAPEDVQVVGDTPLDIAAALAVGAVAVGVASGEYSVSDLSEAGADHVVASLEGSLPGMA